VLSETLSERIWSSHNLLLGQTEPDQEVIQNTDLDVDVDLVLKNFITKELLRLLAT